MISHNILRLLGYVKRYWFKESLLFVLMVLGTLSSLAYPYFMKILIDDVLIQRQIHVLWIVIGGMLAADVLSFGISCANAYLRSWIARRVLFDIRADLYQHLEKLSLKFYYKTKLGDILSRINGDVAAIQGVATSSLVNLLTNALTVMGIAVFLLWLNTRLFLLAAPFFLLFVFILSFAKPRVESVSKATREQIAKVMSHYEETLSNIKLIKSFVGEKFEARKWVRAQKKLIRLDLKMSVYRSLFGGSYLAMSLGSIAVIGYGSRLVMEGLISVGGLVAFNTYLFRTFGPLQSLKNLYMQVIQARAPVNRVFEFIDIQPEIRNKKAAISLDGRVRGNIEFKNVSFYYDPEEHVLKNISFRARNGQVIALVGPTGAGKTTIANLIFRFYDPTEGGITLDGYDLRDIKVQSLRKQIGIVSQESALFHTTIAENIRYGKRSATMDEIITAAKDAYIHDFVESLPQGYDTIVGERGMNLSGGQQQRISIARAILKDPKILILDEATSALDSVSERYIQEALESLMRDRTTLIIAHRLSTIVNADKILVLNDGRIVQQGTHNELVNKPGLYRRLYEEQFKADLPADKELASYEEKLVAASA